MKQAIIPLHEDKGQKKPIPIVRLIVQTVLAISYHYKAYKIHGRCARCVGPSFMEVGGVTNLVMAA
jgi:hypothetical protein